MAAMAVVPFYDTYRNMVFVIEKYCPGGGVNAQSIVNPLAQSPITP